jgi:hypothetical protein
MVIPYTILMAVRTTVWLAIVRADQTAITLVIQPVSEKVNLAATVQVARPAVRTANQRSGQRTARATVVRANQKVTVRVILPTMMPVALPAIGTIAWPIALSVIEQAQREECKGGAPATGRGILDCRLATCAGG